MFLLDEVVVWWAFYVCARSSFLLHQRAVVTGLCPLAGLDETTYRLPRVLRQETTTKHVCNMFGIQLQVTKRRKYIAGARGDPETFEMKVK